jgi:16S rRNA (guanine966-N2)-methyltransferase
MRVVAGTVGGRRLQVPQTPRAQTRPTAELVRGSVLNSLTSLELVVDARVLDIFAGSGALGIEALSRGARAATFVERDRKVVEVLRANLESLGLADRATVVTADAVSWLVRGAEGHDRLAERQDSTTARESNRDGAFDVAMVDPPYAFDGWGSLLDGLADLRTGVVVCESDRPIEGGPAWDVLRVKRHGGSVVTLLQLRGAASP